MPHRHLAAALPAVHSHSPRSSLQLADSRRTSPAHVPMHMRTVMLTARHSHHASPGRVVQPQRSTPGPPGGPQRQLAVSFLASHVQSTVDAPGAVTATYAA